MVRFLSLPVILHVKKWVLAKPWPGFSSENLPSWDKLEKNNHPAG
jgi:hypothetical protein